MSSFEEYRKKLSSKYGTRPTKEDEEEEKKETKADGSSVWDDSFESFRKNMNSKYGADIDSAGVKSWFTNSESTIKGLSEYYKGNDGSKWVSNYGADFTDSIANLKSTADAVGYYLRNNKSEFADYDSLSKAFSEYRNYLEEAEKQNTSLRDFYSQFASEQEYETWNMATKAEEEYQKHFENIDTGKASQGWQQYLADEETTQNAPKHDLNGDGEEKWWEKLIGYLGDGGGVVDTTMPTSGVTQTVNALREDESYRRPNDSWTQEQKDAFGQLYLESPEKAYAFAELTNKINNREKEEEQIKGIKDSATSSFGAGLGHTLGAIATAPLGLADYLGDLAYANAGRDIASDGTISPFEYSQAVTGGISEHLNDKGGTVNLGILGERGWGDVYGLGVSIAQSMSSGYLLGPAGTLVSYFGQGAASGVDDALARGATEDQAIVYGAALGAFEGIAEQIGIDNLFKLGSTSTLKGLLKNILKQAGAEGAEEGLTSILSNIADNVIMQDQSNFNLLVAEYMAQGMSEEEAKKKAWLSTVGDIAFDTIAGAVSGGVSGGLHTGVPATINAVSAKKNFSGQAQNIVNEAVASENAEVKAVGEKYQQKLADGKKLSGWNLSELLEVTDNSKVKSAVEAQLTKLGETGDVTAIADVITKQVQGYELSNKEQAIIDGSKYGQRIVNTLDREKIKSGNYDTRWAKEIGTRRLNADVYNKSLYDRVADAKDAERKASLELKNMDAETENTSIKENAAGGKISAPTGKVNQSVAKATMVDNEGNTVETKVAKIAEVEGGVATFELEGGQTVKASDVDFGESGIGLVYKTATEMVSGVGGFNVDAANVMVRGFSPTGSVQAAAAYVSGFNEAYRYGAMGYPVSALATGNATSKLGASQREAAYNLGKAYGTGKVAVKQANIDSFKANTTGQKAKKGKVYFDGSTVGKSLTERQRASLKGLRVIAEAMGVDIHIFESSVGKDGKRVGENGRYDPVKREIHIDLHAGADGNGVMLFTASHELTHHIREVAPEKFKAFADTLLEEYTKHGASLDALIEEKIKQLKRNNRITPKMTEEQIYDLAYEEVVADSAEAMLVDSNAIEALSKKLQAQDKSLWEKIKDFIAKLVDRIKAAYEGLDPDSAEGNFTREMKDSAEKLQKLWVDALLEASEVDTVLGENGIIVDSKAESASLMSVRDVLNDAERQKVAKALAERFGVTQEEAMDWLTAETSLASLILNPKYSQYLDYTADPNEEAIKSNSDYPQGTVDFSNICKKRRDFTEVINRVLRNFPNHVFAATDLAKIRTIMEQEGMEVACAICYVEDRRQLDGPVAQDFIDSLKIYREGGNTRPDGKPFNANQLKAFSLIEGDTYTPSIYELISLKGRNSLKAKNPAMEEAWVKFNNARGMQSVRLLLNDAEYKRQILKYSPSVVKRKNDHGGLRIYSFSDMEMFHLIDIIQVITDSAAVGLSIQGYTKVNEYAKAVKDTGEKLNRSLIPKGDLGYHMENGRVVLDFDTVEGIDINHPDFFDNINNPNIGNIVIGINATQIKAAMASKFIDQIIPFHTGQSGEVLGEKGIAAWENYKDFQSERDAKTEKKSAHQINIYTEVINAAEVEGKPITNKYEFVNKFLEVCRENNLIPRFSEFLNVDENGDYVYTEGYHKFLVDFKTFDQNTGEYLPQMPVKPIFENGYITQLLKDYVKSQKVKDAELAKTMPKVIERITNEIVKPEGTKYSDRNPRKVTESDVREILGNISSYHKDSYFPVRINTPKALIDAARTRGDVIENLPVVMQVKKAQQAMSNETTRSSIERAHGLSTDDMVAILRAMDEPTYIVYQENGRYVEIVRFETEAKNRAIAVLEIGENKNAIHMNGYEGGLYQVLVTAFAPDNYQYIKDILDNKKNTVLPVEKKKGASQRSSGSQVPSLLNESPFFEDTANRINGLERPKPNEGYAQENDISKDIVAQKAEIVNSKFSDREKTSYAPTFYSHMAKVVNDIKLEKMGSESLLNHLKNRGVKAEELKWSGIEVWLEGKKSVTKAELQEFVAGSQIQIEEEMSDSTKLVLEDGTAYDSVERFKEAAYSLADEQGIDRSRVEFENYDDEAYVALVDGDIDFPLLEAEINDGGSRWSQYKLEGGTNYRELVFRMPNSTYSNRAMRGHWGQDAEGILVHTRIQDFNVNGKRMLFIEELQSDWHNEGLEKGYTTEEYEDAVAVYDKLAEAYANANRAFNRYVRSSEFNHDSEDVRKKKFDWLRNKMEAAEKRMQTAEKDVEALKQKGMGDVPDAPFKNNYHEYVLKRLLRMAAEEGYDSIGWTPADIQSDRWSKDYAEAYRIEYDQEMPKFLRKYGKKWGATVGKTTLPGLNSKETYYDVNREESFDNFAVWQDTVRETIDQQGGDQRNVLFGMDGSDWVAYDKHTGIEYDRAKVNKTSDSVWSMDISESMKDSVLYEGQVLYSDRVTDKKTLDFLENQEHVTVYRAMQVIDGELYPPMAAKVKSDDGKKKLVTPSKIGAWEQAVERPDLIRNGNKFELDKANGSSIQAAYNPYFHTSASPLNDQFSSAYKRPNLVIVEGEIPASELTSGYRAEFAKDTVGETKWHSGPVASKLKGDKARRVFLSRWFKPVRIVPDSEVASIVAKTLEGENIEVPYNVVTPALRTELEKAGVPIKYQDRGTDSYSNRSLLAGALETAAQNDIEKEKLKQYKAKIDLINSEEQKLHELREQIKELSFKKGPRDTEAIRKLQFEANQAANRINTYDRQLLNLESTKALKGVLEREKAQARKRDAQKYKEAIERYREKSAKTQRELIDRYQESRKRGVESRNKTAMRHKIKDVVNELNNYLLKGTKDKHVPIELQKAVAEALDAVNMDTVGAEERIAKLKAEMMRASTPEAVQDIAKKIEHIEEMGGNMAKKISRLKTAYDGIINSDDPLVANSHDEVISSSIEKVMEYVGETSLRDMSLPQLEAVYDMYNMVLFSIRNANKAFKAKKSEEISVIANRVMEEIDKLGKKKSYSTKPGQTISEFDWNNQKPVYAFERIGSDTFTEVFNNVRAGEDIWAEDMTDAQEYREKEYKKHKYDSWDFKKRYAFTSSSGMKFELTLPQIMSLYAYSKREQAAEHLKRGGFVFDETTEVTVKNKLGVPVKFNPTEATAYNISEETLASIISKLTAEQKAFVDEMQDYLSTTMGEKGNEVSLALYGVKLFKEKFYFPLKSATQFMAKAKEQQKGEVKIKNSGFTKETVRKANNPIVLTPFMDVWAGHVNEMSMYHAFTLALEDFYRVYNYKTPTSETMATESVEMFLQNAHGKAATKYIDQLLKDLNGGARVDSTAGIINKLTGMFKKSAVFASLSVVVQQPSAIARATALVDTKYFVGTPSRHKETWAEVKKYAPVAVIKEMGYFDTGMGKSSVEWLKGDKTLMDKVDDVASKAPALADEYAWAAIWNAVKRETVHNNPKLKTSSDEFLKLVGERFTEVVTKTQVYDSVLSRSANMRSKDTGMKMVTAFMGEPTTSLNMLQDALIQGKRGNKKYAAKAIGGVISSMILNSILVSIVYAGRDDDEEKTYAEKYISTLTEELLDSFNPLTLVPFVKDIVSIVQGYDIERSDMAVITDLINAWNNLDSDNRSVYRKVEDFGGAIATIFGLPVKNVMRDVRGMYNTINSFINGEKTTGAGIGNAVVESITGKEKSNGQQLYEAMVKGDSAQVQRIKGRFEDQTAINSAIRKALRENDPRIKEAAEARYNGDITEYMKIAKEIIAEGNFKQDDIVAAINSEINALKKGEGETSTSTSSDKAVSLYSIGDYYSAIMTGATAAAYAVKEDLIETDIANGKDRDEAEASFNSKLTNHIRDMYEEGSITDYKAKEVLTYYAGKTEEEADSKVQYWNFKKEYPDYDLSESAVSKYYSDVQSSGISVDVYYEYSKLRAKAQGEDLNGDGKTDSGSLKKEVMQIINSLPISSYQKDTLYYLNGWSKSTIWEAPWH